MINLHHLRDETNRPFTNQVATKVSTARLSAVTEANGNDPIRSLLSWYGEYRPLNGNIFGPFLMDGSDKMPGIQTIQTPAMPFGTLNWNRQPRNPNDVDLRHAHRTAKSWTGLIKTKLSEYTRDKVPFHGSRKEITPSQYGLKRHEIYLYTLLLSNTAFLDRYS